MHTFIALALGAVVAAVEYIGEEDRRMQLLGTGALSLALAAVEKAEREYCDEPRVERTRRVNPRKDY